MAKQPTNPNQALFLIGFLLLAAGFGSTYFFFIPRLVASKTAEAQARSQHEANDKDIATLKQAQADVSKKETELEAQGVNFDEIPLHFPLTEEMPNLYLQVESIIRNSPTLTEVQYQFGQPLIDANEHAVVPFTFSAVGTYPNLKTAITQLQTNIRPFTFTQVTFTGIAPDTGASDKKVTTSPDSYTLSLVGYARSEKLSSSYAVAPTPSL